MNSVEANNISVGAKTPEILLSMGIIYTKLFHFMLSLGSNLVRAWYQGSGFSLPMIFCFFLRVRLVKEGGA